MGFLDVKQGQELTDLYRQARRENYEVFSLVDECCASAPTFDVVPDCFLTCEEKLCMVF